MERREFLELAGMLTAGAVLAPQVVFGSKNEISDITTVVNDSNFDKEVYQHKGKAIVLFYSMWSEKSTKIFPLFKELVSHYKDKVKFCSYELDESYNYNTHTGPEMMKKWSELKEKYGITKIPTINLYNCGNLDDYISGSPSEKFPEKAINELIVKWIENH